MLGTLPVLKGSPGSQVGVNLIDTVVTQSIRRLFTHSDEVTVQVRCQPPSKLLQGSIDSFKMYGRKLLIRRDFWVEEMSFETDGVSIDFSSVMSGKLRLRQPTQAIAQVILSEEGINRAFQSDLVTCRLQNLTDPSLTSLSGDEPVTFNNVVIELHPQNRVLISANTSLPNCGLVPIQMSATITVERRRRILFNDAQFLSHDLPAKVLPVSQLMTEALAGILNEMVDLDRFDLDGVSMRVNRLETQGKFLVFSGYAQIDHFPGTNF
ncbi:MAG: DUF2993 domain-containing protein [Synechococcales bacterium]|nr:LmeA family phospholipid-binding protein [Cyanobacteria bacterium REEB444]MEB3124749.1 DUF2993 domain-containing protein [Synechococcales bacterium]